MYKSLKLEKINISYTKNYFALLNFSYEFTSGTNYFITGESFSGKSTLARFIVGLEKKYSGKIYLNEEEIDLCNEFYKSEIGFISGSGVFLERKSVSYNLRYAYNLRNGVDADFDIENILSRFDLQDVKDVKMKSLPKFTRIKVCLARLSLRKLSILAMDDIFEGLTDEEIKTICNLVKGELNYKTLLVANDNFALPFATLGDFETLKMKAGFLDDSV